MDTSEDLPRSVLALVRHGRSAFRQHGWVDTAGFRAWRMAYEEAGITEDESPPPRVTHFAASASLIISSHARRASQSAQMLSNRSVVVSPLVAELEHPALDLGRLKLPLVFWAIAMGTRIAMQTLRSVYPSRADCIRVNLAAEWLQELSQKHSSIVVITHASFRKRLARKLVQSGWKSTNSQQPIRPWSMWLFETPSASKDA